MTRKGKQVINKKKKKYKVDIVRVCLIACIVYFSTTFIKQQFQINEYNVKINSVKEDIEAANNEIDVLNETKSKATNSEYIEKVAREELGLVKPYEKIFIDVSK